MHGSALSFAAEVEHQIEALSNEDYHKRRGRSKLLLEEWYPISRLALHLKQPGLHIEVQAFGDDGVADGRITQKGFRERIFDIQVTFVDDYEEALRRELLQSQGIAPGAGPIARSKQSRAIIATPVVVDYDDEINKTAAGIAERFQKKIKISYSTGTVLLIAFDSVTLLGRSAWNKLFAAVDKKNQFCPKQLQHSLHFELCHKRTH
ncbi:hypothetical protein [Uliginosibacterium gangwonense]|uniref:hypothetical protein n=1 Tax=Uliginosibacterium gangwonense TaxID=392736 RepID=UPI000366F68C|nr:hypothetical protein [Uliginosibacterium gangwonense]